MTRHIRPRLPALMCGGFLLLGMLSPRPARGQSPDLPAAIRAAWTAGLRESAGRAGIAIQDARLVGPDDRREAAYREAIDRVTNDQSLVSMALADNRALQ